MGKIYTYKKNDNYGEYDIYLIIDGCTYNNQIIDCKCVEITNKENIEIKTNKSFILYKNTNGNFGDDKILSEDIAISNYLNSEYLDSIIKNENFKSEVFKLKELYYRIDVFESTPDITDVWMVINNESELWDGEGGIKLIPSETIRDWCNTPTDEKFVRLKDVNPYSPTYGEIIEQLRCYLP